VTAAPAPAPQDAVTVVGIGAEGWPGVPEASRAVLRGADVVFGGPRQLALLPPECGAERVPWPSPLVPALPGLLAAHAGRARVVLASGDPMFHGIGRTLTALLGAEAVRVLPHPSSVALACARLGWAREDVDVISVVGRPLARIAAALHPRRRLLVLGAAPGTPAEVAALLRARGFGPSRLRVLEQLGGPEERTSQVATADEWEAPPADPLHLLAVECRRAPEAVRIGAVPGLPDEVYAHDGQLTKRYPRAVTLAALAPAPGEVLWDVGGGSGSIAIEWSRAHPSCRAVSIERDPVRAARIAENAEHLGVPALRVVTGAAPAALAGLPVPDAVFIGGGLTTPGLLDSCWAALPPGGRLVANTVTLESEAVLSAARKRYGGELLRLSVAHAVPVGGYTGWRQAMPLTQWLVEKPGPAEQTDAETREEPAPPSTTTGADTP
jgi:precorrin-6Y C5,15-methyltransferase (decarboxylating)